MHKVYVDGACRPNPGRGAYGYIIYNQNGREVKRENGPVGEYVTNNIAEYTAVIKALRAAKAMAVECLAVYSDSQLVVKQLNGDFNVYDPKIRQLYEEALSLQEFFAKVEYIHIRRSQNRLADALTDQYYLQRCSRAV